MSDSTSIIPKGIKADANSKYDDVFEMASVVDESDVFIEPRCKLCNSANRADAEAYCEKVNWNYLSTSRWLEARGEKITDKSIKNHVEDHYRPLVKKLQVKHYCNDLNSYMLVKKDARKTISMLQAALLKEFLEIGSSSNTLSNFDRLKTADVLIKLSAQILSCLEEDRKIDEEFNPITMAAMKLQEIIQNETANATPEVRQSLL